MRPIFDYIKYTGLNFLVKAEQLKTQTSVMDSSIDKGNPTVLHYVFEYLFID
jgi:hypothetical protein